MVERLRVNIIGSRVYLFRYDRIVKDLSDLSRFSYSVQRVGLYSSVPFSQPSTLDRTRRGILATK